MQGHPYSWNKIHFAVIIFNFTYNFASKSKNPFLWGTRILYHLYKINNDLSWVNLFESHHVFPSFTQDSSLSTVIWHMLATAVRTAFNCAVLDLWVGAEYNVWRDIFHYHVNLYLNSPSMWAHIPHNAIMAEKGVICTSCMC